MCKHVAFFCLFILLCSCASTPVHNQNGFLGRFPINYTDNDGFTMWMPPNMHARQGIYPYVVQRQIDYCVGGNFRGVKYDHPNDDIYKQLNDGVKIYAYYYYYDDDINVGIDSIAFNMKSTQIKEHYRVVINMSVNEHGIITGCKYMRIRI